MTTISFKLPTIEQVKFTIEALDEHIPVRGNVMVSGDDEADKEEEDKIIERLENGDIWAWCCVRVAVSYKGCTGTDYSGCCTYNDEKDFIDNSGYFEDMKQTAFNELIDELQSLND